MDDIKLADEKIIYAKNDVEWSKIIRDKNDGFCLQCGGNATPAHIISRRFPKTRLVIDNGIPLCIKHHNKFDSMSIADRRKVTNLLVGDGAYERLEGMI